jgi:predicted phage terminase large subunit-like protein
MVVSAPPRHGKPLGKDTLVTMADGTQRPIGSLGVGDRVVSGAGRVTTVTAVYDQGELDVFRVRTRGGREFLADGTHRFLTQDGWKRVSELRAYSKDAWQRPRGDSLLVGAGFEREGQSELTPTEARLLGYFIGDGSLTGRAPKFTKIDPAVRAEFSRCIVEMGSEVVPHDYDNEIHVGGGHKGKPNPVTQLLRRTGLMGLGSYDKFVPDEVLRASDEAAWEFLAAYWECDGTGGNRYQTSISSVSRRLLYGCQQLLGRLGVRSSLRRKNGRYKGEPHQSWSLSIYDEARFYERARIVAGKLVTRERSRRHQRDIQLPDTVVSIEPAGREHCYCITVEHDASFLAEGLITHNSESVRHALAWHILHDPRKMHAYVTYAAGFSRFGSRKVRTICQDAGVRFVDGKPGALNQWLTKEGGGLIAEGVNGQLTGKGVDGLFIIDDPIKNRVEAESPILRERIWDFFTDAAFTRLEKNASVIVIMTRWHPDDLAGRLIKSGWGYLNLQARSADGPLWPEMFDNEKLEEIKAQVGEYTWSSLYMGMPTPRGGQLFRDVLTYDPNLTVVRSGTWRLAIGIDLAYTAKTKSDYSVAVVLATVEDGRCFVLDVVREQMEAPAFCEKLKELKRKYAAPMRWYASGTESGSAQFLKAQGLPIEVLPPLGDKFVRAQSVSAAWNAGRVLIPKAAPWAGSFVDEVLGFTGVRDAHDDQVDALASAYDLLYPAVKPAKAQVMSGMDIMRR